MVFWDKKMRIKISIILIIVVISVLIGVLSENTLWRGEGDVKEVTNDTNSADTGGASLPELVDSREVTPVKSEGEKVKEVEPQEKWSVKELKDYLEKVRAGQQVYRDEFLATGSETQDLKIIFNISEKDTSYVRNAHPGVFLTELDNLMVGKGFNFTSYDIDGKDVAINMKK